MYFLKTKRFKRTSLVFLSSSMTFLFAEQSVAINVNTPRIGGTAIAPLRVKIILFYCKTDSELNLYPFRSLLGIAKLHARVHLMSI